MDTFAGGAEHAALDLGGLEARFLTNTVKYKKKLFGQKGRSDEMLVGLPRGPLRLRQH